MMVQMPQSMTTMVDWFQFDDNNNMCYKYIFSVTATWMGRFKPYKAIYCKEDKQRNQQNSFILETLSTE